MVHKGSLPQYGGLLIGVSILVAGYLLVPRLGRFVLHQGALMHTLDLVLEYLCIAGAWLVSEPYLLALPLVFWLEACHACWKPRIAIPATLLASLGILIAQVVMGTSTLPAVLVVIVSWLSGYGFHREFQHRIAALEAKLATRKLQIKNKNKLLSTLSHELRTPLTVIQTSTEILQEQRPGPVNQMQSRFLESTQANVRRMIRLVENILAQIKVEHTLFSLDRRLVDIRVIIRRVIRNMEPFLDDQQQQIRYTFENLIDPVNADDKWIEQVLINLIHNASKHIGEGGRILIALKQNEQCQIISVSDNGSVSETDDRPRILTEFYQGKDSRNDINDGAGLGLAIVRDIIEKHGGKVYISSVPQQGTTISFTLPLGGS